jgi:photosystem II stability/assembly factor-like uncharacterized protein
MKARTLFHLLASLCVVLALTATAGPEAMDGTTVSGSGPAVYGPWHSCKIGGGGYIQNVVLCPTDPQRVYAYVDVGGIYRSDDGGHRWRMMHGGLPAKSTAHNVRSLLVDPRDEDHLLAAVGDPWSDPLGVFVSRDGGGTWRQTLTAPFFGNGEYRWAGVLLARHPDDPDVVLAATVDRGVWRSADNGETWSTCGADGLYPSDLRFDVRNPERLWLCAQESEAWLQGLWRTWPAGLYGSEDGGTSWEKISDAAPSEVLQDPADAAILYGIVGGAVHASRDGGVTWRPFGDGLPPRTSTGYADDDRFDSLAAGPDFLLTASTAGTFYRLRSGESAWRRLPREHVQATYEGTEWFGHRLERFGAALCSIVVDPCDPDHWFFTDWYAIYQTWDAGRHWRLTMDGVEVTVLHVLQQDPTDPRVMHLGMADSGYFRSEDGGGRFAHMEWQEGITNKLEGITNNVKCIALPATWPDSIYAVSARTWHWESNQVFVSDDRGRRWRRSPMRGLPDMAEHHCNSIAVHPQEPKLVYLAVSLAVAEGAGGVYRSTDGGDSWEWIGQGLPDGEEFFTHSIWNIGREIAVGPDGSVVCAGRLGSKVYWHDAARQMWVATDTDIVGSPNCVVADPANPGRFYLAAQGVFRSDDSGATWRRVLEGSVRHVALDLANPARLAAGTADGVALSQDGGQTWAMTDRRLPHRMHNLVAFAGDRLIVGSSGSGAFWTQLGPAD